MKKLLLFFLLVSAFARAQTLSGTITASGCLTANVTGYGMVGIVVTNSGTAWTGTIQPQVIVGSDPNGTAGNVQVTPYSSSTAQATITANGSYTANVVGATFFQVCGNTVTNIAAITLNWVKLAANRNAAAGGSGTVTSVSGTAGQVTVATGTTTPVISLDPASGSGIDSGSGTAYVVTGGPITSLTPTGTIECFLPATQNGSTTPTVAFNGLTAKTIVKLTGAAIALADMIVTQPACMVYGGTNFYLINPQTTTGTGKTVLQASPSFTTGFTTGSITSATNCAVNSVSPAACGSAMAGAFVVPTTTTTYTVNASGVTAASRVFLFPMSFAGNLPSAPTCVAPAVTSAVTISAISAGVSFTFALPSTSGQTCWMYLVVD